jgi:hypothetical protein
VCLCRGSVLSSAVAHTKPTLCMEDVDINSATPEASNRQGGNDWHGHCPCGPRHGCLVLTIWAVNIDMAAASEFHASSANCEASVDALHGRFRTASPKHRSLCSRPDWEVPNTLLLRLAVRRANFDRGAQA